MGKFVIVSDSCCDLHKELRDKYDIHYVGMLLSYGEKEIVADIDFGELSYDDFYAQMEKDAVVYRTSQVPDQSYIDFFTEWAEKGYDVLSISCSSALSASYSVSVKVAKNLSEKYPDRKFITVDSRNACFGEGLLCIVASELRSEGKTIEETAAYLEEHKQEINQYCVPETLTYFKRTGRVTASSAFFGNIFQVKPVIVSNEKGENFACKKIRGRKQSIKGIVDMFKERYQPNPYGKIIVANAHCEEDAAYLKQLVEEAMPEKDVEIITGHIGPIIGATTGPGAVVIYSFGKSVVGEENF